MDDKKHEIYLIAIAFILIAAIIIYLSVSSPSLSASTVVYETNKLSSTIKTTQLQKEENLKKVNINTASVAELITLPGIGKATADKIVEYRTKHGGFKDLNELKEISGIGDIKYKQLADFITL